MVRILVFEDFISKFCDNLIIGNECASINCDTIAISTFLILKNERGEKSYSFPSYRIKREARCRINISSTAHSGMTLRMRKLLRSRTKVYFVEGKSRQAVTSAAQIVVQHCCLVLSTLVEQ